MANALEDDANTASMVDEAEDASDESLPEYLPPRIPERRCLVTGETHPRDALLRFACSPDGQVVFDVKAKLPGRGVWISPSRSHIKQAIDKKLFARGFKTTARADEALLAQVEGALTQRFLNLLQRGVQSREIVHGYEKCASSLRAGEARLVLHALDAASGGRAKLDRLAEGAESLAILTREQMASKLQMENPVHFVCRNAGLAKHLQYFAKLRASFLQSDTI